METQKSGIIKFPSGEEEGFEITDKENDSIYMTDRNNEEGVVTFNLDIEFLNYTVTTCVKANMDAYWLFIQAINPSLYSAARVNDNVLPDIPTIYLNQQLDINNPVIDLSTLLHPQDDEVDDSNTVFKNVVSESFRNFVATENFYLEESDSVTDEDRKSAVSPVCERLIEADSSSELSFTGEYLDEKNLKKYRDNVLKFQESYDADDERDVDEEKGEFEGKHIGFQGEEHFFIDCITNRFSKIRVRDNKFDEYDGDISSN